MPTPLSRLTNPTSDKPKSLFLLLLLLLEMSNPLINELMFGPRRCIVNSRLCAYCMFCSAVLTPLSLSRNLSEASWRIRACGRILSLCIHINTRYLFNIRLTTLLTVQLSWRQSKR